jgi:hypothetical protein
MKRFHIGHFMAAVKIAAVFLIRWALPRLA